MPRFYFNLHSLQKSLIDCEGMILPDVEGACNEARKAVQNFFQPATGRVQNGWEDWRMNVSDQRGRCVFSMAFADAGASAPSPVERRPEPLSPVVVHLDIARAKRQLASVEEEMRTLVRRTSCLVEFTRSQASSLAHLLEDTRELCRTSQALLERSRQQTLLDDIYPVDQPHVGDRARLH